MNVRVSTRIADWSPAKKFAVARQFHAKNLEKQRGLDDSAFLIIDIRGRIIEFSAAAAALLAYSPDALNGRLISQVIPQLPFATDTPYYNLAYAVFHADNDFKMDKFAVSEHGEEIAVGVTVSSVVIHGRRLILLNLEATKLREGM